MAVVVQSVSTKSFVTGTTVVITKPTGLTSGDLMLAQIASDDSTSTTTITPPTDWVLLDSYNNAGFTGTIGAVYYKIATASDTSATDFTFTLSSSQKSGGAMLRIDGFYAISPILSHTVGTTSNTTTPSRGGVSQSVGNSLLVMMTTAMLIATTASNYAIATSNPSWTEQYDFNGSNAPRFTLACATATRPETTSTGNFTWTWANTSYSAGFLIIIDGRTTVTISDSLGGMTDTQSYAVEQTISDTITPTDTIEVDNNKWNNQDKNSSSWVNQNKS